MIKVYLDFDKKHSEKNVNSSKKDRIDTLDDIIDKNQSILATSGKLLSLGEKMKLIELIKATQEERKALM